MRILPAILLLVVAASAHPTPKVVGGRDALEHEAPYIVSFQVDRFGNGSFQHVCGGSILTPIWVLSAAHCITEVGFQFDYQVVAGQHNLAFVGGALVGPFDITVLRLESALTLTPGIIETINLPPSGRIQTGEATLFGWGSTSSTTTPSFPNILQTVTKPIVSWELCREVVNAVFAHEPLHSSNFCTGAFDLNTSACNGDSGGPLVQAGDDGSLEVVGIVSWGSSFPCASTNSVTVYVRTSAFIDWVNERIQ